MKFAGGTHINKTKRGKAPYLRIGAGPHRGRYVHELVAEAMLGRPLIPGEEEVDHKDRNGLNPSWDNLEVVTHAENMRRMNERRNADRRKATEDRRKDKQDKGRPLLKPKGAGYGRATSFNTEDFT